MDLQTYRITAGLEKPLTLLHLSDTHICLADERDNERKNRLAQSRIANACQSSGSAADAFASS